MSTFTYLAYANLALYFDGSITQAIYGMTPIISDEDIELYKLSEFGLSTYDHHNDGEGVCFSSWKRPIMNMRPKFRGGGVSFPWAFPADLSLLWWLENENYERKYTSHCSPNLMRSVLGSPRRQRECMILFVLGSLTRQP